MALAQRQAGEVLLAVRPFLHGPQVIALRHFVKGGQVQALADHVFGRQEDRAVLADHKELDITAFLDRFENGPTHFVSPRPGQVRGQHAHQAAVCGKHRQADINEFHGLTGWVGQQFGQQHGFMHIADKYVFLCFEEYGALADAGALKHAIA